MIELTLNISKKDNFVFIDKESSFAVTRLNLKGVVSCITPSLQRAIDSGVIIITNDSIINSKTSTNVEEVAVEPEKEAKSTKRKPRTKK